MSYGSQQSAERGEVRRCIHSKRGADVHEYGGSQYVAALQRLRASAAVEASRKVEPFYWQDAQKVRVLLCADCAREFGL